MYHQMKLKDEPFKQIKDGSKTIEMRLFDEKRRLLKKGDLICFQNTESGEILLTQIEELYQFPSFKELYEAFPPGALGYKKEEEALCSFKDMEIYYTEEEQKKYGTLAIKIKLIKKEP